MLHIQKMETKKPRASRLTRNGSEEGSKEGSKVGDRYHNISSVDWQSLLQRRMDSRLFMLYKIRNHLVAIDEERYLKRLWKKRTPVPQVESSQRLYTLLFLS